MKLVTGEYFNGRSAIPISVQIEVTPNGIIFHLPTHTVTAPLRQPGKSPAIFNLGVDGEVILHDTARISEEIARLGISSPQSSHIWSLIIAGTLALIGFGYLTVQYLVPIGADLAASAIPEGLEQRLGASVLSSLSGRGRTVDEADRARFEKIRESFNQLSKHTINRVVDPQLIDLGIGANAVALPGGYIVVTPPLLDAIADDEEVLAILGHELGHVVHRHPVRGLLRSAGISAAVSVYLGDIGGIVAAAPAFLLSMKNSREFEAEADQFAAEFLSCGSKDPTLLGRALSNLESDGSDCGEDDGDTCRAMKKERRPLFDFISSHPATEERAEAVSKTGPLSCLALRDRYK